MEKVTSDIILEYLKGLVESKKPIQKEIWLDAAFKLNLLRIDEAQLLNKMRQSIAQRKLETLKQQGEKKNVAAAKIEVETTDEYRFFQDQEDKIYSIDEFIRIAKKNADINF